MDEQLQPYERPQSGSVPWGAPAARPPSLQQPYQSQPYPSQLTGQVWGQVIAQQFAPVQLAHPAAWYPAPDGNGQQYWDGQTWTGHRAP